MTGTMSPDIFSCVICGYSIRSEERSYWLEEFRAVYSNAKGTFISSVGRYYNPYRGWRAPSDSMVRWDDAGDASQHSDVIPVIRQVNENGLHGFVTHNMCWKILQKFYEPDDVPLERLLEICRSLPQCSAGVWLGHDYSGLIILDTKNHYPWEGRVTGRRNILLPCAEENPYDIAEMSSLLMLSSNLPRTPEASRFILMIGTNRDCFATLPWELIEAICVNLSVPDILSLVRASRSFHPILTSQTFWATRFEPGKDRELIFEKWNSKEERDWIKLYQLTNRSSSSPGLENRRHIWDLVREFAPSLDSSLDKSHERPLSSNIYDKSHEVTAEILPDPTLSIGGFFNQGCLLFHKQHTAVPPNLSGVAFSITANYITGIRLISPSQEDICLGYIIKNKETALEVTAISGFILAVDSRGVRAIRAIDGNGNESRWFGNPKDTPITKRLTGFKVITALEIGVDGYKIISIAAAEYQPTVQEKTLRLMALWYPAVPSPELNLNDQYFTGEDPLTGYRPLAWIHFGGPQGCYLRNIKAICVTRQGNTCCIEFEYDIDLPVEIRKLGRREVIDYYKTARFEIDGRAGEYITKVAVSTLHKSEGNVYQYRGLETLSSFKITTNHGRLAHFISEDVTSNQLAMAPLSVEPGTTVTGFYASQHPQHGLISLGVISELVPMHSHK
ncbi:hypothetical protein MaudCBS49596_002466 [Microsporum audouinii]